MISGIYLVTVPCKIYLLHGRPKNVQQNDSNSYGSMTTGDANSFRISIANGFFNNLSHQSEETESVDCFSDFRVTGVDTSF